MKLTKMCLYALSLGVVLLSCKKAEDEDQDPACVTNNTMEMTFKNTGTVPLRVQMATQLTPQFQPINPVAEIDLAPGQTVEREIVAGRYFFVWSRDCATTCSRITSYAKDFSSCNTYTEQQGL